MPYTPETSDAIDSLAEAQLLAAYQRSAWKTGCDVTVGASTTSVDVDITSGTVKLEGSDASVSSGSVTLSDGHIDHPRVDVVYVDAAGALAKATGAPEAPKPGDPSKAGGPDYDDCFRPAPYDMGAEFPAASVLATVWVPANATESADLPSAGVVDRRIPYVQIDGLTQSEGDSRYINESGDTMGGQLQVADLVDDVGNAYVTDAFVAGARVDLAVHAEDAASGSDIDFAVDSADPGPPDTGTRIWFDTS